MTVSFPKVSHFFLPGELCGAATRGVPIYRATDIPVVCRIGIIKIINKYKRLNKGRERETEAGIPAGQETFLPEKNFSLRQEIRYLFGLFGKILGGTTDMVLFQQSVQAGLGKAGEAAGFGNVVFRQGNEILQIVFFSMRVNGFPVVLKLRQVSRWLHVVPLLPVILDL
jgi:hypothetical protein